MTTPPTIDHPQTRDMEFLITDDWQTQQKTESHTVGYAGHFADLPTEPGKAGNLIFTLRWQQDRWEGRNFEVHLEPEPQGGGGLRTL